MIIFYDANINILWYLAMFKGWMLKTTIFHSLRNRSNFCLARLYISLDIYVHMIYLPGLFWWMSKIWIVCARMIYSNAICVPSKSSLSTTGVDDIHQHNVNWKVKTVHCPDIWQMKLCMINLCLALSLVSLSSISISISFLPSMRTDARWWNLKSIILLKRVTQFRKSVPDLYRNTDSRSMLLNLHCAAAWSIRYSQGAFTEVVKFFSRGRWFVTSTYRIFNDTQRLCGWILVSTQLRVSTLVI